MKTIEDYYWDWIEEEPNGKDKPFSKDSKWQGNMVLGFVAFVLKQRED